MKIFICKDKSEANRYATKTDRVVPYGQVYAVVAEKDYLNFIETTKEPINNSIVHRR